jgi:hypothetical protein
MLQQEGFEVTYLNVEKSGLVNMEELEAAIRQVTHRVLDHAWTRMTPLVVRRTFLFSGLHRCLILST